MNHVELFKVLAERDPRRAADYVRDAWCWPILFVYAIDISQLNVKAREEVIAARIFHKREVQMMYRWLKDMSSSDNSRCTETLATVDTELAEFANKDRVDGRRFVLDITGWTDVELYSFQRNGGCQF